MTMWAGVVDRPLEFGVRITCVARYGHSGFALYGITPGNGTGCFNVDAVNSLMKNSNSILSGPMGQECFAKLREAYCRLWPRVLSAIVEVCGAETIVGGSRSIQGSLFRLDYGWSAEALRRIRLLGALGLPLHYLLRWRAKACA